MVTVYSVNKAKHMNTLCVQSVQLLDVFAQLQNPTNNFVTSVSFSACKQLGDSYWTDFRAIYLFFMLKAISWRRF